jgi:hypothetical protein
MATYTPQDGEGVIISNTKDTKVTLDSEVVHAVVDSGTVTTVSTVTAVTGITNAVTVNSHAVTNAGTFAVQAAAQPGVDVGDVTINNSTGASAVNIQDGGNTITVDGAVTVSGAVTNTVLSVVGTGTEATAQRVTIASDSTGVLSVDDNGASLTVDNATIAVVGSGTEATAQRVTIATDSTGVISVDDNGGNISIDDGGNVITVDGAVTVSSGTITTVTAVTAITNALPAGTNAIGKLSANSGVDIGDVDVTSLPALATGTNTIGNVVIVSGATGGATSYKLISAATTNATSVKASAGKLIGYYLSNANAAVRFVKFYNKASAPTVGTDTPVLSLMIPAGGAANLDSACGIDFGTGIAFATTTGAADSDTGAVAANEIIVNLWYK